MKLSDHELFHQDLQQPQQLLQQLQQLSQQLLPLAGSLPAKHRQKALKQLLRQSKEVEKDAAALCKLIEVQQQLHGQDPLCPRTAADISMAVMGLDDDAIEDELSDDVSNGLEGLDAETEQRLRRVFAVTDTLSRQQLNGLAAHVQCSVQQVRALFIKLKSELRDTTLPAVNSKAEAAIAELTGTPIVTDSQELSILAAESPGSASAARAAAAAAGSPAKGKAAAKAATPKGRHVRGPGASGHHHNAPAASKVVVKRQNGLTAAPAAAGTAAAAAAGTVKLAVLGELSSEAAAAAKAAAVAAATEADGGGVRVSVLCAAAAAAAKVEVDKLAGTLEINGYTIRYASKFLQAAAELHTWTARTHALTAIQISFKGLSSSNNSCRNSKPPSAAAAAAEGVAPVMVRMNMRSSSLVNLLQGWLAAAEQDAHVSFLQQLLQVMLTLSESETLLLGKSELPAAVAKLQQHQNKAVAAAATALTGAWKHPGGMKAGAAAATAALAEVAAQRAANRQSRLGVALQKQRQLQQQQEQQQEEEGQQQEQQDQDRATDSAGADVAGLGGRNKRKSGSLDGSAAAAATADGKQKAGSGKKRKHGDSSSGSPPAGKSRSAAAAGNDAKTVKDSSAAAADAKPKSEWAKKQKRDANGKFVKKSDTADKQQQQQQQQQRGSGDGHKQQRDSGDGQKQRRRSSADAQHRRRQQQQLPPLTDVTRLWAVHEMQKPDAAFYRAVTERTKADPAVIDRDIEAYNKIVQRWLIKRAVAAEREQQAAAAAAEAVQQQLATAKAAGADAAAGQVAWRTPLIPVDDVTKQGIDWGSGQESEILQRCDTQAWLALHKQQQLQQQQQHKQQQQQDWCRAVVTEPPRDPRQQQQQQPRVMPLFAQEPSEAELEAAKLWAEGIHVPGYFTQPPLLAELTRYKQSIEQQQQANNTAQFLSLLPTAIEESEDEGRDGDGDKQMMDASAVHLPDLRAAVTQQQQQQQQEEQQLLEPPQEAGSAIAHPEGSSNSPPEVQVVHELPDRQQVLYVQNNGQQQQQQSMQAQSVLQPVIKREAYLHGEVSSPIKPAVGQPVQQQQQQQQFMSAAPPQQQGASLPSQTGLFQQQRRQQQEVLQQQPLNGYSLQQQDHLQPQQQLQPPPPPPAHPDAAAGASRHFVRQPNVLLPTTALRGQALGSAAAAAAAGGGQGLTARKPSKPWSRQPVMRQDSPRSGSGGDYIMPGLPAGSPSKPYMLPQQQRRQQVQPPLLVAQQQPPAVLPQQQQPQMLQPAVTQQPAPPPQQQQSHLRQPVASYQQQEQPAPVQYQQPSQPQAAMQQLQQQPAVVNLRQTAVSQVQVLPPQGVVAAAPQGMPWAAAPQTGFTSVAAPPLGSVVYILGPPAPAPLPPAHGLGSIAGVPQAYAAPPPQAYVPPPPAPTYQHYQMHRHV